MLFELPCKELITRLRSYIKQQLTLPTLENLWPLEVIDNAASSPPLLLTRLEEYLSNADQPVLLLLGDPGMGKTLRLKALAQRLQVEWSEGKPIPIFLKLSNLKTSFTELLEDFFITAGFRDTEIAQLKNYGSFIIMADAYDASLDFIHLCSGPDDAVLEWKNVKWIISSRTHYFFNQPRYLELFSYYRKANQEKVAPQVLQLMPLSVGQIKTVISSQLDSTGQNYVLQAEGLLALSSNILMLTLLIKHITEMTLKSEIASYQWLFFQWISYQVKQLKEYRLIDDTNIETLEREAMWYVTAVARRLNDLGESKAQINFNSSDPFEDDLTEQIRKGWQRFLTDNERTTQLARACCPLQADFPERLRFFCKVVYEKVQQFDVPLPTEDNKLPLFLNGYEGSEILVSMLYKELYTNNPGILNEFIGKMRRGEYSMIDFWRIIYATRYNDLEVAAANSITVLNSAQIPFSGMNLSKVRIKGANLSHGIFHQTNFENSQLEDINFLQPFLRDANLSFSEMTGVQFGEEAYWKSSNEIKNAAFNEKTNSLLVVCYDGNIYLFDMNNNKNQKKLMTSNNILDLVWCNDDIVFAGWDNRISLLKIADNKLYEIGSHKDKVSCLAWNENYGLVSGGWDSAIILWLLPLSSKQQRIVGRHYDKVNCLLWCGALVVSASYSRDNTIRLWNIETNAARILVGHKDWVTCLALQNNQLVSGSRDSTIKFWNVQESVCTSTVECNIKVKSIAWQGDHLAISGVHNDLFLLNIENRSKRILTGHSDLVIRVFFKNNFLVSCGRDKTIRFWSNLVSNEKNKISNGHTGWIICFAWNDNYPLYGFHFASTSEDATIQLWNTNTKKNKVLTGHTGWVTCIVWKDNYLFSGSNDLSIRYWNLEDGSNRILSGHKYPIKSLALHNKFLASGSSEDGEVRIWNLTNFTLIHLLSQHTNWVRCLTWFCDWLASASFDNTVRLRKISEVGISDEIVLIGHEGGVTCLAWKSEHILASGGWDKTIKIWDLLKKKCIYTLVSHQATIVKLHFIKNSNYLISWAWDGQIKLWDCSSQVVINQINLPHISTALYNEDTNILVTGNRAGCIYYWQPLMKQKENTPFLPNWQLQWKTRSVLDVTGLNFFGANVEEGNAQLLRQHGAESIAKNK